MSAIADRDAAQIERIIDHCHAILDRVERHQVVEEKSPSNDEIQDMLPMPLSQIGERPKCLSSEFRSRHQHLPWRDIAGMRDIIDREYDNIDLAVAWTTVLQDIEPLLSACERILEDSGIDLS